MPERWLPEGEAYAARHRQAWVPFGAGAQACIGRGLAMLEAHALLAVVLRTTDFSVAAGYQFMPQYGVTVSAAGGVLLNVSLRD